VAGVGDRSSAAFVRQEPISEEIARNMLSWPHSGFNIHIGPRHMADDGNALQATTRHAAHAPISLSRLHYDRKNQSIAYHYTSAYDHQDKIERLSPRELIARLATHIPDHDERLIRYSGVYANRSRKPGSAKTSSVEGETATEHPIPGQWRRQWQQLLQPLTGETSQIVIQVYVG